MSQDEHPQKCARARHKARTEEGSNNALQSDLYKCLVARNLATPFQLMRVTGNETEMDVKQSS